MSHWSSFSVNSPVLPWRGSGSALLNTVAREGQGLLTCLLQGVRGERQGHRGGEDRFLIHVTHCTRDEWPAISPTLILCSPTTL